MDELGTTSAAPFPGGDTESFFRGLVEGIPGVAYVDEAAADGRILYLSPRLEELLGYTPAELGGSIDRWNELVVFPDDLPLVEEMTVRTIAGAREGCEYRCRARSGEIKWVRDVSEPVFDEAGTVVAVRGFIFDITARKQAEESVAAAEERYRRLVEEAPAIVYVDAADKIGTAIYVSPQIEQILGYTVEEYLADPDLFMREIVHPDHREQLLDEIVLNNEGVPNTSEYRCIAKDGRVVWIYDESWPQRDARGEVVETRGFMLDVTARKEAEAELVMREEQLRRAQRMEAVGRLAGGVAHDFNNLLMVIRGNLDLVLADDGVPVGLREPLVEVADAAERASRLTAQLLAFGRRQVLQPAPISLGRVLASLDAMFRRLLPADIDVIVRVDDDLRPVLADRSQLEQVVANLVLNGRDAMPAGGTLRVEAHNVTVDVAGRGLDGVPPGDYVELRVADTGEGMDEQTRERMFEPFFTTKGPGAGTGLGLATVEGIVVQSRGHIVVESAPNVGTTISILLPVADLDEVEPELDSLTPEPVVGTETVLVVEDDLGVRRMVRRMLVGLGYGVIETASPAEALTVVEAGARFDLLLTDLVMPGGNGRALADEVRRLRPDVGVVMMSGYTDDELVRRGVAAGTAAFLQKPFRRDDLAHQVRDALDRR